MELIKNTAFAANFNFGKKKLLDGQEREVLGLAPRKSFKTTPGRVAENALF